MRGITDAGAFKTDFIVNGNTTSIEVPGLNVGNTTTISITDRVRRNSGDSIPIKVMVDPENSVAEANETNNVYTTNVNITASENRWQGGRFSRGYDLVTFETDVKRFIVEILRPGFIFCRLVHTCLHVHLSTGYFGHFS